MTTTPVLAIAHIIQGQSQKELTANEAFDDLTLHLAEQLVHNFTADSDYTLDAAVSVEEHRVRHIVLTDTGSALTTTRSLIVPSQKNRWTVKNETAQTITVKTISGVATRVAAGQSKTIYCDAADCESAEDQSVDFAFFLPSKPGQDEDAVRIPIVQAMTFPLALRDSRAIAATVASATALFTLAKNGTVFASITFAAGASAATLSLSSATTLEIGDVFSLHTPAVQDDTLADVGFMLRAFEV